MEFRFANPIWLWLLTALPLLAAWQLLVARPRQATLRFSDLNLMTGLAISPRRSLQWASPVMRYVGLALLIGAMARPQSGDVQRDVFTEGVDIMLVLDCSGSMEATDFRPSRLEAAKDVIASFIGGRTSDRIGLVLFAGESFTACPLTLDYSTLTDFLDRVRLGVLPYDGTAIGTGMLNALHRLQDSKAESKVVILLTDGANNRGHEPLDVAALAADLGVKVYTIGVGTPGSRDLRGGFNPRLLEAVAEQTGGKYFHATDRFSLAGIYEQIDEMETTEVEYNVYAQWDELMKLFIWPALFLLCAELVLRNTRMVQVP